MQTTLVKITGNTFPVKDRLNRLGARWNRDGRFWEISEDKAAEAQAIVEGQTAPARGPQTRAEMALSLAPSTLEWSVEQAAIFEWFANGTGNLVVQARAGTGKTTTIKEAFKHAREMGRFLYAVFNKKNQREAEGKITDSRVEVRTLHSLGLYFIRQVWKDATPEDDVELARVMKLAPRLPEDVQGQLLKLIGFAKNLTVGVPSVQEVMDIAEARGIQVPEESELDYPPAKLAGLAIDAMKAALEKDQLGRVSFADMVWLPVAAGWVFPTFTFTVVDEAQDMNMPQLIMAIKATKADGRICIVGDNRQAIYGFRGAASDGMAMMQKRLNAAELGLTVTYRCPKAVVAKAQEIVKDYTAAPSAPEGEVLEMDSEAAYAGLVPGDAVISRLNAPLMGVALGVLRRGVAARIEGRDIGKQLIARVRKFRAKSVPDFMAKVSSWGKKQTSRIMAAGGKNAKTKAETVTDEVLTLHAVAEGCANVDAIVARIQNLFEDSDKTTKPAVVCSSVHKAKGLEWNKVCLVASTFKNKSDEGEEANIYYVAVTRAKKTLIFAR